MDVRTLHHSTAIRGLGMAMNLFGCLSLLPPSPVILLILSHMQICLQQPTFENTGAKGEIADDEQFLRLP